MKFLIVLCACAVAALCAPAEVAELRSLPALEYVEERDELNQYSLRYVTAEGTIVSETGKLVPTPDGDMVLVHEGEYSYIGDDGRTYVTKYSTDLSGGYKVVGDHLPKAPELEPVPENLLEEPESILGLAEVYDVSGFEAAPIVVV